MCADDLQITLTHVSAPDSFLMVHAEIPWDEATNDLNMGTRMGYSMYTNGAFLVKLQFLDDTTIDLKLKNGSDIVVSMETDLQMDFSNVNKKGTEFDLRINDEQDPGLTSTPLFSVRLYRFQFKKSGALTEITAEFDYSINSIFKIAPNILISFFLKQLVLPENLVVDLDGSRIRLLVSLPPSDEPFIPCLGLPTDPKNMNYALNCFSWLYSLPSFFSRLTKTLSVDNLTLLRMFMNEVKIGVSLQKPNSSISTADVWSINWSAGLQTVIQFADVPQQNITQALSFYLAKYRSYKLPKLPKQAAAILQEIPEGNLYNNAPLETFDMKYVEYLSNFLRVDEFFDAQ